MSSVSSLSYLAPSGSFPEGTSDQPLPPQGQQNQSWLQSKVQGLRNLFFPSSPSMTETPESQIKQAEAELAGRSSWKNAIFGSNETKVSNATELYQKAAVTFRNTKRPLESGKAWERKAQIERVEAKDPHAAALSLQEAWKAYRDVSPDDSIRCGEEFIQIYVSNGEYSRAASHQKNLADQIRSQFSDTRRAIEAYTLAATWYDNDNKVASADGIWNTVAELAAINGDYYKAIEIYDHLIENHVTGRIQNYRLNSHVLKAGLCHFATNDLVATNRAIDSYVQNVPNFVQMREGRLLHELSQAAEAGDDTQYQQILIIYKRGGMDEDTYKLALKGYEAMKNQEEDFS